MRKVVLALLAVALPAISAMAESPADKQMAQRIGTSLKQSGQLHNYEIGVKYHDGVACLEGKVTSQQQRMAAVRLAQKIKGVARVECKLAVADEQQANEDEQLQLASVTEEVAQDSSPAESVIPAPPQPELAALPAPSRQPQMMPGNARMASARPQRGNMPLPSRQLPSMMPVRQAGAQGFNNAGGVNQAACVGCNGGGGMMGGPGMGGGAPMGYVPQGGGAGPNMDNPNMPGYAWPSYASYPNYAALSYPKQYSPTAWPYIGPFYPYPQVPLAWRKVSLEWDDGWWFLDFSAHNSNH